MKKPPVFWETNLNTSCVIHARKKVIVAIFRFASIIRVDILWFGGLVDIETLARLFNVEKRNFSILITLALSIHEYRDNISRAWSPDVITDCVYA